MTFDDGILTVYSVDNSAPSGDKPVMELKEKDKYYYGYHELGITRYYEALKAEQQIACVVNVPGWNDIQATDICALDNGIRYTILMTQPTKDEDGLRIMRLSLERIKETDVGLK